MGGTSCLGAGISNACGSTDTCTSTTDVRTLYHACGSGGSCDTAGNIGFTDAAAVCAGTENDVCVGSGCINACGNGVDDDNDGIIDACDADCTGNPASECPAGVCCAPTGCYLGTDSVCASGTWTCTSSCVRERSFRNCSGSESGCGSGPGTTEVENCPLGTVCSAGDCIPVAVNVSCASPFTCPPGGALIQETYLSCDGSGSCGVPTGPEPKVVVNVATCPGTESSRCVDGVGVCSSGCANGVDDDADGYVDGCDSDCGGPQCFPGSGPCCVGSGILRGCYEGTSTVCGTANPTCVGALNCSRSLDVTRCSGTSITCSGATTNEIQPCPRGTVCDPAGACSPPTADGACGSSPPSSCSDGQTPVSLFYGCNGTGLCDGPGTSLGSLLPSGGPLCGGTENDVCSGGACVNGCSNGIDDDGDGFVDGCDSDCGGIQCTSGPCCDTDVGSPTRGCYRDSTALCSVAGSICLGSCSLRADLGYCPGTSTDCVGGTVTSNAEYACPLGSSCSSGSCVDVGPSVTCDTPVGVACLGNGSAQVEVFGCDGAGSCRNSVSDRISVVDPCGGHEGSWCLSGSCVSACADGIDNDGDGLVDVADSDCAGSAVARPESPSPTWSKPGVIIPIALLACCILLLLILLLAFCSRSGQSEANESLSKSVVVLPADESSHTIIDPKTGARVDTALQSGNPQGSFYAHSNTSVSSMDSSFGRTTPGGENTTLSIVNPVYSDLAVFEYERDLSMTSWGDTVENVVYDEKANDMVVVYDASVLGERIPSTPGEAGGPVQSRGSQLDPLYV